MENEGGGEGRERARAQVEGLAQGVGPPQDRQQEQRPAVVPEPGAAVCLRALQKRKRAIDRVIERRRSDLEFQAVIVFVTSVSAELVSTMRGEYCVSKAGLSMTARLFAARLAAERIPVYEVRPGIIATDMTASVKEMYDRRIAGGLVPEPRWGQPADVGNGVAALLRGDLSYATGSVLHIDGGLSLPRL